MRTFNLIVACSENRVIGRSGRLPWRIAEDRDFFMAKTAGQIVVLGRLGFESWPGAVADGRRAVVLASHGTFPSARSAPSLPEALAAAEGLPGEIYICGGQQIYEEAIALPQAARLYLTLVHAEVQGDRFFPDWTGIFKREVDRRESSDANWRYTFLTLER